MKYTPEQQAEHRRLWVEALRSGRYMQGQESLRSGRGFCCLGVACDISGLGEWYGSVYDTQVHKATAFLPDDVRHWLGLADNGGLLRKSSKPPILAPTLSSHNDRGASFAEIADLIESGQVKLEQEDE